MARKEWLSFWKFVNSNKELLTIILLLFISIIERFMPVLVSKNTQNSVAVRIY